LLLLLVGLLTPPLLLLLLLLVGLLTPPLLLLLLLLLGLLAAPLLLLLLLLGLLAAALPALLLLAGPLIPAFLPALLPALLPAQQLLGNGLVVLSENDCRRLRGQDREWVGGRRGRGHERAGKAGENGTAKHEGRSLDRCALSQTKAELSLNSGAKAPRGKR
jgi:hypothetical protein